MSSSYETQLYVIGIKEQRLGPDSLRLTFHTNRGDFGALARIKSDCRRGVVMLSGADGGFDGPGSIYPELAEEFMSRGIASLRLDYRAPGDCAQCGIDAVLALQYLDDEAVDDVVVIGWSFGAAVAIAAGSVAKTVRGVAAVSAVDVPGCGPKWLRSKPILLIHGDADSVAPLEVPRRIFLEAGTVRQLIVYPGAGHELVEARDRLRDDLLKWALTALSAEPVAQS